MVNKKKRQMQQKKKHVLQKPRRKHNNSGYKSLPEALAHIESQRDTIVKAGWWHP